MINHIDVSVVLRGTVCDLYSNLVTRPTGAAVRAEIEQQLAELGGRTLTVIDFSQVGLLDFSCADEIVAKLLLKYRARTQGPGADRESANRDGTGGNAADRRDAEAAPTGDEAECPEGYFVFRGINDSHLDAIEAVLEHHGLALVADWGDHGTQLVGSVDDQERRAWQAAHQLGAAAAEEIAAAAAIDPKDAERVLESLWRRRLLMRVADTYVAIGARR